MAPWWHLPSVFLVALALSVLRLPADIAPLQPPWLLLVIAYGSLYRPDRFGVVAAWCCGLLLDVLLGSLLGAHALGFALCAYLMVLGQRRLRAAPVLQQALWVALFTLMVQGVYGIAEGLLLGVAPPAIMRFLLLPAFFGALLWPPMMLLLQGPGHHRRVESG